MGITRNQTGWSLESSGCAVPASTTALPRIPGPPLVPRALTLLLFHVLLKTCLLQEAFPDYYFICPLFALSSLVLGAQ